jgi:hypothetical protein
LCAHRQHSVGIARSISIVTERNGLGIDGRPRRNSVGFDRARRGRIEPAAGRSYSESIRTDRDTGERRFLSCQRDGAGRRNVFRFLLNSIVLRVGARCIEK